MKRLLCCLTITVVLLLSLSACDDERVVEPTSYFDTIAFPVADFQYLDQQVFRLGFEGTFGPYDRIQDVYFFETVPPDSPFSFDAALRIDPSNPAETPVNVRVRMIAADRFAFVDAYYLPRLVAFDTTIQTGLGMYVVIERWDSGVNLLGVDTIGDISGDTLNLFYLKSVDPPDPADPTWELAMRNCYSPRNSPFYTVDPFLFGDLIGVEVYGPQAETGVGEKLIDHQEAPDGSSEGLYIQILGLDQYNRTGQKLPDGRFDYRCLIFPRGLHMIAFPHHHPFATDTIFVAEDGNRTARLREKIPELYDRPPEQAEAFSQYQIQFLYRVQKPPGTY